MTTINDMGDKNVKELSRVYNVEVNIPYAAGGSNILLRREKLLLVDNNVMAQTQLDPIIKNFSNCAKNTITIFDPITGNNTTISILALMAALQQFGQ